MAHLTSILYRRNKLTITVVCPHFAKPEPSRMSAYEPKRQLRVMPAIVDPVATQPAGSEILIFELRFQLDNLAMYVKLVRIFHSRSEL